MAPEIFSDFLRYSDCFHKVKDQECLAREAHYIQSIATADRWNTDFLLQKSSAFPMGILQEFLNYFSLVAFRDQEFLAREAHYLQSLATADRWNTDYFLSSQSHLLFRSEFLENSWRLSLQRDQEFLACEAHYLKSIATAGRWNKYFFCYRVD